MNDAKALTVGGPIDANVDLHVPARRRVKWWTQVPVVIVVALGGMFGAAARYGIRILWPVRPDELPWSTLLVNVAGCAVIGVLMVVITEVWATHRLVRPFIGTGVLGGFTTFSTYAVDIQTMVNIGHARQALLYLVITVLAALIAVWTTAWATRRIVAWRRA